MEDKLLIEIQRIKKVMLLESGPGNILRGMVRSFTGNIDRGKILQQLRDVDALDDATLTQLGTKTGDSFFDELVDKINSLKTRGVGLNSKYLKSLEVLLENIGEKGNFDSVIDKIENLNDAVRINQEIELFVGKFNNPELQEMFRISLKEIETQFKKNIDGSTLKRKIKKIGEDSNFSYADTGLPLTKAESIFLQQKYPVSLLIEDLYRWVAGFKKINLSKEEKINSYIKEVYERLKNTIVLDEDAKFLDFDKQFAMIWNDINKVRILSKGNADINDVDLNTHLFETFLSTLNKKGVSYDVVTKLKAGYKRGNPLTRPTWWDNLVKKDKISEILDKYLTKSLSGITKIIGELTYQVLSRLLMYVSTGLTKSLKEVREILYKRGTVKGYRYIAAWSLAWSQLIFPLIASVFAIAYRFFTGLGNSSENTPEVFKKDMERIWLGQWKTLWDENKIGEMVYKIIKKVLFPFKNLWPQIFKWFSDGWLNIKNYSLGSWDAFKSIISSAIKNLIKTFGNLESEIKNRRSGVVPDENTNVTTIDNTEQGFKNYLKSIGKTVKRWEKQDAGYPTNGLPAYGESTDGKTYEFRDNKWEAMN